MFENTITIEWLLLIGAFVISMIAQSSVTSTYKKYSSISTSQPLTGSQVAQKILSDHGIYDVQVVQQNKGTLSDHYDARKKIVALSPNIYDDNSIASIAVAAHEVGHAIQHAQSYVGIKIRDKVLPFAMISSQMAWVVIFISFAVGWLNLTYIGIAMIGVIGLFQLVTLPVEFDASNRALKILSTGYLDEADLSGAKKMLSAAAFTYVAAFLGTLAQIGRLLLMSNRNRRD